MKKTVNKNLKTLLIITLFIILFASLEALVNAKSIEALNNYKVSFPDHSNQDYINLNYSLQLNNIDQN